MHRFFIIPEGIHEDRVHLSGAIARRIARVLRLKPAERCVVLDNTGDEYAVILDGVYPKLCSAWIVEKRAEEDPAVRLLMLLCLTQRGKFEWMLQKCTGVEVAGFLPLISQRSLIRDEAELRNKYTRWVGILREAAEQSRRSGIPGLFPALRLKNAVQAIGQEYPLRLIPWEREKQANLKSLLKGQNNQSAALLIGPEGRLGEEVVSTAKAAGFQPIPMGKRILRMATAAVVSAALILHELA
jgi:16S rRNA (uracil1498-N3)-methyltransferase